MSFVYNYRFAYPDIKATTHADGDRVYHTPVGDLPSVTTILGTLPNPALDAWRVRVGEAEADRISKEASTIGSFVHNMAEAHVKGFDYDPAGHPLEEIAKQIFQYIRMVGLRGLDEVWGIETALYYQDLYAGRTDLVGLYKNIPSIIDYKTSLYAKPDDHIEKYKLQLAAYAEAHEKMFPEVEFRQGVLLIGIRPNSKYNKPAQMQRVIIDQAELTQYRMKWTEVLHGYYQGPSSKYP